jgi:hypothetical protein
MMARTCRPHIARSYAKAPAAWEAPPCRQPLLSIDAIRNIGSEEAATLDMDVQELLGEAINMTFERHGVPTRIEITSGRR